MPYPDYLDAIYVHVAILTYPVEGAQLRLIITSDDYILEDQAIDIPPGTAPYAFNSSCVACYSTSDAITLAVNYMLDPDTSVYLEPESLAILYTQVVSASSVSTPATVTVSVGGLEVGEQYFMDLWCNAPAMVVRTSVQAISTTYSASYTSLPGMCRTIRYLVISSADQVHVVSALT